MYFSSLIPKLPYNGDVAYTRGTMSSGHDYCTVTLNVRHYHCYADRCTVVKVEAAYIHATNYLVLHITIDNDFVHVPGTYHIRLRASTAIGQV